MPTTADPGQRSFELDARLPWPPDDLRPMLPRAARRMPDGAARLVDPTWGGLRVLASVRGQRVRLLVDGLDASGLFPDLVASLVSLDLPDALLDGEIVVPGASGRALLGAVRGGGPPIQPASLVVSDLPWHAGHALIAESLIRRRERLSGLAIRAPHLVAVEPAVGTAAVLQVVALHGLVGIIAKRADSPYLPGIRSRLWTLVRVADVMAASRHAGEAGPSTGEGSKTSGSTPSPGPRPDIALLRTLPLGEDA